MCAWTDINRLNEMAGLQRVTIFLPDGASDYMRTRLNRMSEETFAHFIEYQKCISERQDPRSSALAVTWWTWSEWSRQQPPATRLFGGLLVMEKQMRQCRGTTMFGVSSCFGVATCVLSEAAPE